MQGNLLYGESKFCLNPQLWFQAQLVKSSRINEKPGITKKLAELLLWFWMTLSFWVPRIHIWESPYQLPSYP